MCRFQATFLSFLCVIVVNVGWANIEVDVQKSPTTFVDYSANGVDLINIAAPSDAGVSVNRYRQFSVDSRGAILNNSTVIGDSRLGGVVYANPNLNRSARVILNEVSSSNQTEINGALEVFGDQASVVVANPNGIHCNGCAFINTSRLSLVTGSANLQQGDIGSFNLSQGAQINIGDEGLDGRESLVELGSSLVKISGALQAQDISIKTGNELLSYYGGEVYSNATGEVGVAIDAAYIGAALYANNIEIIATQQGFGVHAPKMVSTEALTITTQGELVFKDTVESGATVSALATGDITQQGDISAGGTVQINSTDGNFSTSGHDLIA